MNKTIGIIGLGLIGGSFAKAFKCLACHKVYGYDISRKTVQQALDDYAIDLELNEVNLNQCDIIFIALYPNDTKKYVIENIHLFKKSAVLIDCAGVKADICAELSPICAENEVYFIGGHPMAGKAHWGFTYSSADLFAGASMILCKDGYTNDVALKQAELLLLSIGFGNVTVTTAEVHDKMIAFTSQLAHIVSSSYIKSETAKAHKGFSAGSFKDLTRVAKLNENMWTELFFQNRDNLLFEIDGIIEHLNEYKQALENDNPAQMQELLKQGRLAKEATM